MAGIVGIDLGTTKSALAVWQDNQPQIITDVSGERIVPSVVALHPETGEWVVGSAAKSLSIQNPEVAIYSAKRLIGRRFSDHVVQKAIEDSHLLYDVEQSKGKRDSIEVVVGKEHLTPQQVAAKLLEYLRENAETKLNKKITDAVITVPAYFLDSQRQATRDAGRIAQLAVKRVLSEPTAACLAFGFQKLAEERKTVAVYDLGGGTFDISILDIGRGPFSVRATNGNTYLGGDDIDWAVVGWVVEQIAGNRSAELTKDVAAMARLRAAVEQAKKDLSSAEKTLIEVAGPLTPTSGITDVSLELTRAKLEELSEPFIEKTLEPCERALHDARVQRSDIKEVLLVGGQTRMPRIRQAVRDFFGIEPNTSVSPEEVVALGAAVAAAIISGEAPQDLKLADVVPLGLGVATKGMMNTVIPRNTLIPVSITKTYSTAEDNQDSVEINIYQGEATLVTDNNHLGGFILGGILPAPAEEPEIEVTFKVDEDGILHVTGKDMHTGNLNQTTITNSMRLSDEEIESMIEKGESNTSL
jgi:molecular chaperone DnaK